MDTDGNTVTLSGTNGKAQASIFLLRELPGCVSAYYGVNVASAGRVEGRRRIRGRGAISLSVTIDPAHDTTDVLKDYANRFDTDPKGWKFLRGDEKETAALAEKYGISVYKDPKTGDFSHMNLIVLLDKDGQIREWINVNDYIEEGENNLSPSEMAKMIKSVL